MSIICPIGSLSNWICLCPFLIASDKGTVSVLFCAHLGPPLLSVVWVLLDFQMGYINMFDSYISSDFRDSQISVSQSRGASYAALCALPIIAKGNIARRESLLYGAARQARDIMCEKKVTLWSARKSKARIYSSVHVLSTATRLAVDTIRAFAFKRAKSSTRSSRVSSWHSPTRFRTYSSMRIT